MSDYRSASDRDIAQRNAGRPVLTIWPDGSYVRHGKLDAEADHLSTADAPLVSIDCETFEPVTFLPLQTRINLIEKFLLPAKRT